MATTNTEDVIKKDYHQHGIKLIAGFSLLTKVQTSFLDGFIY